MITGGLVSWWYRAIFAAGLAEIRRLLPISGQAELLKYTTMNKFLKLAIRITHWGLYIVDNFLAERLTIIDNPCII